MKLETQVGERGQVTIPKKIRDQFGIQTKCRVEFEVRKGEIVLKPKQDMSKFDAGIKKWRGALRKQFLADGYTSVDELIEEMRGR